jgi:hypothetical protein
LAASADADPRAEIFRLAVARGWTLVELAQSKASLEDVFVRLTTNHPAEPTDTIDGDGDRSDEAADEAAEPAEEVAS